MINNLFSLAATGDAPVRPGIGQRRLISMIAYCDWLAPNDQRGTKSLSGWPF